MVIAFAEEDCISAAAYCCGDRMARIGSDSLAPRVGGSFKW